MEFVKGRQAGFVIPLLIALAALIFGGALYYDAVRARSAEKAVPPPAASGTAVSDSAAPVPAPPASLPAVSARKAAARVGAIPPSKTAAGRPSSSSPAQSVSSAAASSVPSASAASSLPAWQPGTKWVNLAGPDGSAVKTAVTWPSGPGPFPAVILLHGSEGFRQTYVDIAAALSQSGFITLAPCWFTGFHAPLARFSDYIDCPGGRQFDGANLSAVKAVLDPVIAYAKTVQGGDGNIGLIGSSRGATMALLAASNGEGVRAVVSVSAIYEYPKNGVTDDLPIKFISGMNTPVLILAGTADQIVNVQEPRDYEAKLSALGKTYESHYYDGAPHAIIFTDPYATDVSSRAAAFFKEYLR